MNIHLQANLMIKGSPSIVAQLNNLTEAEAQAALGAVGKSGSNLARAMSKLNHNSRAFLALLKRVGGRIPGSPTEKLAQRSKALAAPIVFGSCTIMANICPAEIASNLVFEMGEPKASYTFNALTGEIDLWSIAPDQEISRSILHIPSALS